MIQLTKLAGDARAVLPTLPENHFHCCITSVPYWGLRSYLPKDHPDKAKEIGTEPTFEIYLQHIVEVFDQVRRVLREDGTLWLNCGDCYHTGAGSARSPGGKCFGKSNPAIDSGAFPSSQANRMQQTGMKPKDLMMMPARVAMALQASGWYLRSMIPWIKRNAMPESVDDRPATAVEYVFLLSKSERYYYDRYAVMMPSSDRTHPRIGRDGSFKGNRVVDELRIETGRVRSPGVNPKTAYPKNVDHVDHRKAGLLALEKQCRPKQNESFAAGCSQYVVGERNRRNSDWLLESWQGLLTDEGGEPTAFVVNPKGTSIAHFAAFPTKLVAPMILAGTSEKGCCAQCGAPVIRQVEKPKVGKQDYNGKHVDTDKRAAQRNLMASCRAARDEFGLDHDNPFPPAKTVGWTASCACSAGTVPCRVLDPFSGISTTLVVARDLGRASTGIDINAKYLDLAKIRDAQGALL